MHSLACMGFVEVKGTRQIPFFLVRRVRTDIVRFIEGGRAAVSASSIITAFGGSSD